MECASQLGHVAKGKSNAVVLICVRSIDIDVGSWWLLYCLCTDFKFEATAAAGVTDAMTLTLSRVLSCIILWVVAADFKLVDFDSIEILLLTVSLVPFTMGWERLVPDSVLRLFFNVNDNDVNESQFRIFLYASKIYILHILHYDNIKLKWNIVAWIYM